MNVFISHSAHDGEFAHKVAGVLEEAGLNVVGMSAVGNGAGKSPPALGKADAMLFLVTQEWLASSNMSHELEYALGHKEFEGRVFTVLAGGGGDVSTRDIPWILNQFQVFELPDDDPDEESVGEITRALATAA
jgi:hypothetical protein